MKTRFYRHAGDSKLVTVFRSRIALLLAVVNERGNFVVNLSNIVPTEEPSSKARQVTVKYIHHVLFSAINVMQTKSSHRSFRAGVINQVHKHLL